MTTLWQVCEQIFLSLIFFRHKNCTFKHANLEINLIRRLKNIVIRFFLLASFFLVMLSVILSFSAVQTGLARIVTNRINQKYDTEIQIDRLDLSSIRKVRLRSILIRDHRRDTLFSVGNLETSILNYRNLFRTDLEFGDILLERGVFNLRTYEGDSTNNLSLFVRKFKKDNPDQDKTFRMRSSSIQVEGVDFNLYNENKREGPIVYYRNIHGVFDNFNIDGADVRADIHDLRTVEDHDVEVVNFSSKFHYTNTRMEFVDTWLKTSGSELNADIFFDYELGDLSDFTNKVQIDANFKKADIVLSDLKKFYGEFGRYDKIHFSARAKGTINDFEVTQIDLSSDRFSLLRGNVNIVNVLDREQFLLTGEIRELSSNYDHLVNLLPNLLGSRIPKALEKIGYFSSSGRVKVTKKSLDVQLKTIAELGLSDVDLSLNDIDKGDEATYKGRIELIDFKLGRFVNDSLIGDFSMVGEVEGEGFSIDNVNINVRGNISKHQYKGYTYSNININGVLMDRRFDGYLLINDPNLQLEFKGLADISEDNYQFNFQADVAHADFNRLNLFTRDEKSILKGTIEIDLKGSNLDNIEGMLSFKNASYSNQNDDYFFKDFAISSYFKDTLREVTVNSTEIINGYVRGDFKFRQLKLLGQNSLGSLFVNYEKKEVLEGQYLDFRFNIYNKIVEVFYPDLVLGANTIIYGEVNSDLDIFKLNVKSPRIEAFDFYVDRINLQVDNQNPLFNTLLSVDELDTKYYNLSQINLVNVMLNDTLFMRADMIGGKEQKERYNFSVYHTFNEKGQSVVGMKKSELFFKGNSWFVNPEDNNQNKVVYDAEIDTYAIDDFNLVSGNQKIHMAGLLSRNDTRNIDVNFDNVNLFDVTPTMDSVRVDGKLNGNIQLRPVNGKILPIAELVVNYFSINDDYYGDFEFSASSDDNIRNYSFETYLINSGLKTFSASGAIDFSTSVPTMLANVYFEKFRIGAFSPLGKNVLSNIRGLASGEVTMSGLLSNPDINGEMRLEEAGIKIPYLNVNYDFEGESVVKLYDHTFDFQRIDVVDDAMGTRGEIAGTITHEGFKRWILDLELNTDNLLVLNTQDTEGALYYGTGLMSGATTLKGYTDQLDISVRGTTRPGTEFYIPLGNTSTVNTTKLIHFEAEETEEDEDRRGEVVFERFKGLNLNFNLNVTRDALAEIVIDRNTGSSLRGRADGNIRLNIDTNGRFEMYGSLTVDQGEYKFRNIVNKDFIVQRGGTVIWDGNPYDATLDILAINYTRANPAILLEGISSSRKIDVELHTGITGKLSAPDLSFDVIIPNANSNVASELDFKLRNEDDKLTQFFSLLATGSFAATSNNRTNFDGNAAIAGTIAQKASQLLSSMLESENENFQVGVTYDIGTDNTVQDVTTDDQLGVEVSGRIADKVVVSGKVGVPVGSNTNSNIIGEVEVRVPLNDAETFWGKVYNRQNEIQFDVIEGQGYTQGVGISYSFDFNNGGEFMEKVGLKKTEEEKLMSKEQLDSLKVEKKIQKKQDKKETP
jgi:hypothetical protein